MIVQSNSEIDRVVISGDSELELRMPSKFTVTPKYSDMTVFNVHGLAHGPNFYDHTMADLALNHGINSVAVNLRGNSYNSGSSVELKDHSLNDYKDTIIQAIECRRQQNAHEKQVIVAHSMGGRCVYELLAEDRLPASVKGIVFVNPVPISGVGLSATAATAQHALSTFQPTPITYALAILKNQVGEYLQKNPTRSAFLFFSKGRKGASRIVNEMSQEDFADKYLYPESSKVAYQIMLPSKVKPNGRTMPVLCVGSHNDRVVFSRDVAKMASAMQKAGNSAVEFYPSQRGFSHDAPMDIDYKELQQQIVRMVKEVASDPSF